MATTCHKSTTTTRKATMVVIFTLDEILQKGLELCGFDRRRQSNVKRTTNLRRFKSHFGSNPIVYAQIWEDLQTTEIPEANISSSKPCIDSFLMAMHLLKRYPTEDEQEGIFKICDKTARKWAWFYVQKVQALKKAKVSQLSGLY